MQKRVRKDIISRALSSAKWEDLSDVVLDDIIAAICSAIADTTPSARLDSVIFKSISVEQWAWLIYALDGRASCLTDADNVVPTVIVRAETLTNAIVAVRKGGFPEVSVAVYGFRKVRRDITPPHTEECRPNKHHLCQDLKLRVGGGSVCPRLCRVIPRRCNPGPSKRSNSERQTQCRICTTPRIGWHVNL